MQDASGAANEAATASTEPRLAISGLGGHAAAAAGHAAASPELLAAASQQADRHWTTKARHVKASQLQPCNHTAEVQGLDQQE
jgi:acetylornithine deacetylase/succinyl-diaminopimelate desuccinylase-like protein